MNFNRRKRDGARIPQISAIELRWFVDVQAALVVAGQIHPDKDKAELFKDVAKRLGDCIPALVKEATAKN